MGARESWRRDNETGKIKEKEGAGATGSLVDLLQPRLYARCAEGFTGLRCETKDVSSTGSVYNRRRAPFSCKLGLSTSYYC
ncbi:hypothetical protein ALC62_12762 [Cyphomyrmex costatus]|uniref:EGF-like domain-containing protein n=1 Tax=Cyphomyrmex costatus TaxID=456900 RepID=A0A151IAQ7_9HYME|nr:hypothetical protein ALC62_12762 [Cyphomyrmex costatus]